MAIAFDAEDKDLSEILFGNKVSLRIPRYQRPYSWSGDEIDEFWTDISNSRDFMFIGSIILNNIHHKSEGYYEVIDGQQRLITLTIMMAVLRDTAQLLLRDTELAALIQRNCIACENWEGKAEFRLHCGESLARFFRAFVQTEKGKRPNPQTDEEILIEKTYAQLQRLLQERLAESTPKEQRAEILRLYKQIGLLKVIQITIDDDDYAYEIFEAVNAKGVELSVADLLKNWILKHCRKDGGDDEPKRLWAEIEKTLADSDADLTTFIRHYWLSKYAFVSERRLYRSIKNEIESEQYRELLAGLHTAAKEYALLLKPTREEMRETFDFRAPREGDKIHGAAAGIKAMRATQCLPLWLCLTRNRAALPFKLSRYFKYVELFTLAYSAVSKLQANRVEKLYSKYAVKLQAIVDKGKSDKDLLKSAQSLLDLLVNELKELMPERDVFLGAFASIEYGRSEQRRALLRYILGKLNEQVYEGGLDIRSDVTLEHIYPQRPDRGAVWKRKEIRDWVDNIGNLALLTFRENGEAGNKLPKKKVNVYANSDIRMNHELSGLIKDSKPEYGEDCVEVRAKQLAQRAHEMVKFS